MHYTVIGTTYYLYSMRGTFSIKPLVVLLHTTAGPKYGNEVFTAAV